MLQKLLALSLIGLLIARVLFRPRLRELGQRFDRFVNVMVIAILLSYIGQLLFLFFSAGGADVSAPVQ